MATQRPGTPRSADSVLGIPSLELALGVLSRIPGPHSLAASICFASGEYQRGAELRVNPEDFTSPDEFALALLSFSLLRKYPGLPGSEDRAEKAISKWLECEAVCLSTNDRLREFRIGQVRPDLHEPFRLARKKIQKLLGDFRWAKVANYFDFGPGSTTRLPYSKRHLPYKYGESPETTFDNLASAAAVIGLSPTWCKSSGGYHTSIPLPALKIREESKVTTVPKDAFIDRVIAIEPCMNMYVQKGFGGYIRRRLKHVGVDLNDQTLNQLLARDGSRGGLATIDLSSASDTVAYELVRELLPPDWFEALLSCRTHSSRLPSGEVVNLQKFSSMGNGFTFELESLIFWALCSSVCTRTVGREGLRASVYGDDIVVTVDDFDAVVDILCFSGFSVNKKKTYASGPYRESCGKHYFHGRDVTPITVTKEITHATQLLLLCNNLTRWAVRTAGSDFCRNSDARESYEWAVAHLPQNLQRPRLPDGYGDGALIGPFALCRPARCRKGWDGWRVPGVLLPKQRYRASSGVATLTACLSKHEAASPRKSRSSQVSRWLEKAFRVGLRSVAPQFSGGDSRAIHKLALSSARLRVHAVALFEKAAGCVSAGEASTADIPTTCRWKVGKMFVHTWGNDIGPWI